MKLIFTDESWADYMYWVEKNKKVLKRLNLLIKEIKRDPYNGIGKPEPLKFQLQGCWSRRINNEHRIVYQIYNDEVRVISCRYHY